MFFNEQSLRVHFDSFLPTSVLAVKNPRNKDDDWVQNMSFYLVSLLDY